MKIGTRTDIETSPKFDVRFIGKILGGEYDNIYLILSTLEDDLSEAWEEKGESFLLINLPKEKIINATIDYKSEILKNLPKLSWLKSDELTTFVQKRWN